MPDRREGYGNPTFPNDLDLKWSCDCHRNPALRGPNHANQPTQINVQNPAEVFAAASISVPEIGHKSTTGRKYSASRSLQWRIPYGHQRLTPLLHLIVWYFDTTYVGPRSISGVSHPAKLKILWQRRLDRVSSTTANALAYTRRTENPATGWPAGLSHGELWCKPGGLDHWRIEFHDEGEFRSVVLIP